VVVFVSTFASVADLITSVTYGGVALTRLTGGSAQDAAGELGRLDAFFLGSGLGTGNQTITVNRTNNARVMYASAATVTAGADTAVPTATIVLLQGDGTLTVQSVDDTSPGVNSLRYAGAYSGLNAPPGAGTGSTLLNSIDIGNYGSALVRETTAGQGARNVGFSAATDDRAVVHLAIRELVPRTETPIVGTFTLTGNAATFSKGYQISAGTGTFTFTGNPADLRHNVNIEGGVGTFTLTGQPNTLAHNVRIDAAVGTFSLTGQPATFTVATAPKILSPVVGNFALNGNAADLRHNVAITGDRGQFFLPERNMRLWSESFDNAAWTKVQSSITANATTAPDGTLTADALIENTTPSTGHFVTQNITFVTGRTYTASCYFKLYPGPITRYARLQLGSATVFGGDTYININLAAGTITATVGSPSASGITNEGNGWYRAWLTKQYTGGGITTGSATQIISTTGTGLYTDADGLSGIYIWGAQYEEGSLSDYDPTGPNAATRTDTRHNVRIDGGTGSFSLVGNQAGLAHNPKIDAGTGIFSLVGNNVTLTKLSSKQLAADVGLFSLTGQPANLAQSQIMPVTPGIFALSGNPATLKQSYLLIGSVGTFSFVGNAASLLHKSVINPTFGEFLLTGEPAVLTKASTGRRRNVLIF
jgi:hypothetical protein